MSWPQDAYVGMKVVCVDASQTNPQKESELVEGKIYHIRWIGIAGFMGDIGSFKRQLCIRLEEINPRVAANIELMQEIKQSKVFTLEEIDYIEDMPFRINRFRPVQTKSTDTGMAILREILDRETVKEPERQKVKHD